MASITKRTKRDGKEIYLVQIRVVGSKTVSKTFADPVDARRFADMEEVRIRREIDRFHPPDPAKFYKEKFSDVIADYLARTDISKKHRENLKIVKRNVGSVSMAELRTKWVKSYVQKMQGKLTYKGTPYAEATIAIHLSVMASVYKWRAEEYDLDEVKLPFSSRHLGRGWDVHRERRLSKDEEQRLISGIQGMSNATEWLALLTLALETAARQQELIFATWSEISTDGFLWTIPAAHTKTKKTRRVPLSDAAIKALDTLRQMGPTHSKARIFAFLSTPSSACSAFRSIVRKAGVEGLRFHDLRHEAISRMVLYWRQYSVFEIMQIVGHSSTEMLNRYANLRGEELVAKMRPNEGKSGADNSA